MSFACFALPSLFGRYNQRRASSLDFRNNKSALRIALKNIKKETSDPYLQSSKVLYKYIKAKLYLKTDKLDPLALENILNGKVSERLIKKTVLLAQVCDAGRFSPESNQLKDNIKVETINLLKDLDRLL